MSNYAGWIASGDAERTVICGAGDHNHWRDWLSWVGGFRSLSGTINSRIVGFRCSLTDLSPTAVQAGDDAEALFADLYVAAETAREMGELVAREPGVHPSIEQGTETTRVTGYDQLQAYR